MSSEAEISPGKGRSPSGLSVWRAKERRGTMRKVGGEQEGRCEGRMGDPPELGGHK